MRKEWENGGSKAVAEEGFQSALLPSLQLPPLYIPERQKERL